MNRTRRDLTIAAGALGLAAALRSFPARAADAGEAESLVAAAQAVVEAFTQNQDNPDFVANLGAAKGILIFPQVLKAGFVLGVSGGNGVLLVRDQRTGSDWHGPAFYRMTAASVGLQLGASSAQVVILVRTRNALDSLYTNKVDLKLGGDVSWALWNKGMGAAAAITEGDPEFLAFSTAKGAFAGFAIDGAGLSAHSGLNEAYYGQATTPKAILLDRVVANPAAAKLHGALKQLRNTAVSEIAR